MKKLEDVDGIDGPWERAMAGNLPVPAIAFAEGRKVVRVDKPKAGFYPVHFDDGSSLLLPRLTKKLGVLDKAALKFWAANIERELVADKAAETFRMMPVALREKGDPAFFREQLIMNLGEKKAHQMRLKEAGDIGTALHKAIQEELKASIGDDFDLPMVREKTELDGPALLAYMAWEEWRDAVDLAPTHVETSVASESMNVAGTMDCAGNVTVRMHPLPIDGFHCFFDWKSSKRSKTAPNGIYPESEIQVSVYRRMGIEMGIGDESSWAAVVRLPKNENDPCLAKGSPEPFDVKWIEPERADYLAKGFLHIGAAFSFMQEAFPK